MPKLTSVLELALPPKRGDLAAYRWLYSSMRDEILRGRLRPGARLPSTRDFAEHYGLARGTVVTAFEQLKSEGYVQGSTGSGTYVSSVVPENLLEVAYGHTAKPPDRPSRPI